jgi:hypothetical protein
MTTTERAAIYPALRAAERCVAQPGVLPVRLFEILVPLWQVEISAQADDREPYDLVDKFVARAIAEGGVDTADGLAELLGLTRSFVDRVLHFLDLIGHVVRRGDLLALTPLGLRSLRDDTRYVQREARQKLLFDGLTMAPLPREHYAGDIVLLPRPSYQRFQALSAIALGVDGEFRFDAVTRLLERPDLDTFNVPHALRNVRILGVGQVYLPVYLVDVVLPDKRTSCLAFSQVAGERDTVMERLVAGVPGVRRVLDAEDSLDSATLWGNWLERRGLPARCVARLPNGLWRATLPASQFGEKPLFPLSKLGSFEVYQRSFLQLWCDDPTARRKTVSERGLALLSRRDITTRDNLAGHLASLSRQLAVDPVTIAELRESAERQRRYDQVNRIDGLT